MKEFRIYGEIGSNDATENFKKFMREIEAKINADSEIIERAKKCNNEFAENIKKIFEDSENFLFSGSMIAGLQNKSHRYSYLKHLEFNGEEYEAEIDELERKFYLRKVK